MTKKSNKPFSVTIVNNVVNIARSFESERDARQFADASIKAHTHALVEVFDTRNGLKRIAVFDTL